MVHVHEMSLKDAVKVADAPARIAVCGAARSGVPASEGGELCWIRITASGFGGSAGVGERQVLEMRIGCKCFVIKAC